MAKDARGNELKIGDVVSLEIPSTRITGEIHNIIAGGLIAGVRSDTISPGTVTVLCAFSVSVDPKHHVVPNLLKLHTEPAAPPEERNSRGLTALEN